MPESVSGFHFISSYQTCPRRFMLKYVYHLEPEYKNPSLLFGIAIHAALEDWATKDLDSVVERFIETLLEEEKDYEKKSDFQKDLIRGKNLLYKYEEQWREADKTNYELLGSEIPFEVELANGFKFTGRIDRVVREKGNKNTYIIETKTTSYSSGAMAHSVAVGDQVTAYLFGARKTHPEWKVLAVIPDVLYNRNNAYSCERFTPIMRTELNLKEFELQIIGQLLEISQKVQNLDKYPWPYLFPRNCGATLYKCPYEDICRLNLKPDDVPIGFKREKESEKIINNLVNINDVQLVRRSTDSIND